MEMAAKALPREIIFPMAPHELLNTKPLPDPHPAKFDQGYVTGIVVVSTVIISNLSQYFLTQV
jgi:hypothetical protein